MRPDSAVAQEGEGVKAADTSSPRATLKSFIDACSEIHRIVHREKYFDRSSPEFAQIGRRVIDCLDISELPAFARDERAGEVAVCLKEILDRTELPPWDEIPDSEAIEAAGGFEKLSRWRIPGTRITIARVEEGPQRHEYLFSTGTVERAVRYFEEVEPIEYRDRPDVTPDLHRWYLSVPGHPALARIVAVLPERMQRGRICGLAAWKWPGLLVALLVAGILMVAAYRLHFRFRNRWRQTSVMKHWLTILFPVVAMLTPFIFKHVAQRYLTIRGNPLYIISFSSTAIATFAGMIVIFAASNRIAESIIASPRIDPLGLNAQLIRIVSKLASIVAGVTLFLMGGQYLGIPVATLLASAGIGGLAIAFGAQDTLKTLFGTLMLMADKPFRVGERIVFGNYDGVVEDIGLRSTKIRLLTGHQVTVPNDELSRSHIENIGRRPHIRRKGELLIPLDTPCEKIEKAVATVREKLDNHEGMDPEKPPRVFFLDFTANGFCIQFFYWYTPPEIWKYRAFTEKLNFEIFRAFEAEEIQFSLPFRHTFWKHDAEQGPLDVRLLSDTAQQPQPNDDRG
ncbi:MAG: mechanosensitive ion channel family protein [Planctomycetes bacterium]|nr:mechanosensitive ion channel family protein [Planctomycetota bacterium]